MTVIGLAGRQGSGKSTVSSMLDGMEFRVVSMGDAVRAEAERRGLEPTGEVLGEISEELREEGGKRAVAELLVEEEDFSGDVVIDGIRSDAEAAAFREELEDFFLVAVTASGEERFRRVTGRGRSDDVEGREAFEEKERREDSWGLQGAIEMADLSIRNEDSLEDLGEEVRKLPAKAARVEVRAEVKPTETEDRVEKAVSTLFPELEISIDGAVEGEGFGADLEHFRNRVFEQRVIDTVRNELEGGRRDSRSVVELDKGAAWADRVNFHVGGSLGPITLEVRGRLDEFIDWVAPPTVEGKPVEAT